MAMISEYVQTNLTDDQIAHQIIHQIMFYGGLNLDPTNLPIITNGLLL